MKNYFITVMALCMMVVSCGKITPDGNDPVKTGKATQITQNSAILWGSVNPSELGQGVEIGIMVSTSENPSAENSKKLVSIELDSNNMFSVEATGLKADTKYYYKAFLNFGGTYRVGDIKSFTTEDNKIEEYQLPSGAVNLGLPSGLKWASCNLGASTPEGYGDYYSWGETALKTNYDWSTYKWCNGSSRSLTKYCTDGSLLLYGIVDNKAVLEPDDDVAHVKLGGSWRMPTYAEWSELMNKCTWTWTTHNGVSGYLVTGPNGNNIFLPAAGCRDGLSLEYTGSSGHYWSSCLVPDFPDKAFYVVLHSDDCFWWFYDRCLGQSVRPVTK